jgi:hypothetical protein
MFPRIHIISFLLVFYAGILTAQTDWDNYDKVLAAVQSGMIDLPEAPNYKITIGSAFFSEDDVKNGKVWVYYLIKWTLSAQQLNTSFVLRDTLDPALDGGSVTMISSSNPYQLNSSDKQIYSWSLSEFTEGDTKEGHVYFKVKIKHDTKPSVIRNTAYIELQSGESIRTSTASIQVLGSADVATPQWQRVELYPNPSQGHVFLRTDMPLQVEVFDAFGRLYPSTYSNGQCTVVKPYPPGLYQVRAIDLRGKNRFIGRFYLE